MSTEKAYMDVYRLVGMEGEEALTIGPDADSLGRVRIHTNSVASEEYWGNVDVNMSPAMARKMAAALIAAADEAEAA